jgi:2-methylcitrate dehydratase PrpD
MTEQPGDQSGTAQVVAAALRRLEEADAEGLARHAGFSLFDFAACVRGGRAKQDLSWADEPARLALAAHLLDRDDLHPPTLAHPGGVVWPAVVTAARGRPVSGADAVAAVALGYEVCAAVARLLGPDGRRFWHATAVAGTAGAAAAAARTNDGLASVVDAVGHALSVAGGSIVCILERSDTRLVHRAHAATAGVLAARAAGAGLGGTRFGLESPRGFLAAVGSSTELPSVTGAGPPAIAETAFRLHAASGFAHAAIDAAAELGPLAPDQVGAVSIEVSPAAAALAGLPAPVDDAEAWWSIQHAVAVVLTSGDADQLESGRSRSAEVTSLASRCSLETTRSDLGARIQVELRSGQRLEAEAASATGHPERPLTDAQRLRKWELLAGGGAPEALAQALAVADLPFADTVGQLLG